MRIHALNPRGRVLVRAIAEALAELDAVEELEVGVKVAVDSAEAPAELRSRADLVVPGTAGLVALLRTL